MPKFMFLIFYVLFNLLLFVTLSYGLADYIGNIEEITVPESLSPPEYSNQSVNALTYMWDSVAFMFTLIATNPFSAFSLLVWFWVGLTIIFIYVLITDLIIPALDLIPFT